MAFSPIAFIAPNFRDFSTYWVKPYIPGTTTPKPFALESDGGTQVAKLEINADGFLKSAGGALVIPYIDGSYDMWMFPSEAEADSNDTSNALRIADDITGAITEAIVNQDIINDLSQAYEFETRQLMIDSTIVFPIKKALHVTNTNTDYKVTLGSSPEVLGSPDLTGGGYAALKIRESFVDVKVFGAIAGTDATANIDAALLAFTEVRLSENYEYDVITMNDYNTLRSLNGRSLTLIAGHTPVASTTVQGAGTTGASIIGIKFIGLGVETNTYRMVSFNESVNFTMKYCWFEQVHGTCIRLNKSDGAFISRIDFDNVTGDVGDPGEGIYALGIIHAKLEKLSCSQIGDHLIYLQGNDTTDFNRVEDVKISQVSAYTTGVNGLTGGAAIIFYNQSKNMSVRDVYTKNCRSGLKLGLKTNYTGLRSHQLISFADITNETPTNRGIEFSQDGGVATPAVTFDDASDRVTLTGHTYLSGDMIYFSTIVTTTGITVGQRYFVIDPLTDTFKVSQDFEGPAVGLVTNGSGTMAPPRGYDVSLADVKTVGSRGGWGTDIASIDYLDIANCDNIRGAGGGLSLVDCNEFIIDSGNNSSNINGHGILISVCKDGSVSGGKAQRNKLANLNISGACDRVYAANINILPLGSADDPFIMSSTATNCVMQNLVLRDAGSVINSNMYSDFEPTEGRWNKGDRFWSSHTDAGETEGWVCTTSGVAGVDAVFKTFGIINA